MRLKLISSGVWANQPPVFHQDIDKTVLPEDQPVGSIVYTLIGSDPEGAPVRYGIVGTDRFQVDPLTGKVTLVKPLDHEVRHLKIYFNFQKIFLYKELIFFMFNYVSRLMIRYSFM